MCAYNTHGAVQDVNAKLSCPMTSQPTRQEQRKEVVGYSGGGELLVYLFFFFFLNFIREQGFAQYCE